MFSTSFIGFSKGEVNSYLVHMNYEYEKLIAQMQKRINDLAQENYKLQEEIRKLKETIEKNQLKEFMHYETFINEFFFSEWEEYYTKKASEVKSNYDKILKELEELLENIKKEIMYLKNKKVNLLNELNNILIAYNEVTDDSQNIFDKKLKTDFIVNNQMILPKDIVITAEILNGIKEKGLLIELLKHIAREEEL